MKLIRCWNLLYLKMTYWQWNRLIHHWKSFKRTFYVRICIYSPFPLTSISFSTHWKSFEQWFFFSQTGCFCDNFDISSLNKFFLYTLVAKCIFCLWWWVFRDKIDFTTQSPLERVILMNLFCHPKPLVTNLMFLVTNFCVTKTKNYYGVCLRKKKKVMWLFPSNFQKNVTLSFYF